jgi:polysaccharide biosynthesis protein PslH
VRILYFVPYAPSLIRVRPYQLIRALARRGHEVTVTAPWSSPEEFGDLRKLSDDNIEVVTRRLPRWRPIWNCLRTLPTRLPLQAAFSFDPGLLMEANSKLESGAFDIAHVEHLRGSLFGLGMLDQRVEWPPDRQTPVVWDSVDCISHLFQQAGERSRSLKGRWMARLELSRTRRFEGRLTRRFDKVLATSVADRDALVKLAMNEESPQSPVGPDVEVLPNGVDLDYFQPARGPRDIATLVFTGKMSYHANVTAAQFLVREIMPRVWTRRPDVSVYLVGQNPPRSLRALASMHPSASTKVNGQPAPGGGGVAVTGTVPDIRPYLERATLSVLPLVYGAGIQNKVLEAMACATPVITSPRAVQSLSTRPGRELVVADGADAFADAVLELIEDRRRAESIGRAGRTFVEAHHDWDDIGARLERIYGEVIASAGGNERRPPMVAVPTPTEAVCGAGQAGRP